MQKPLYKDYDSLFEKFSILTVDGKLSDAKAIEYLRNKTTPDLIKKLEDFLEETIF